MSNMAMPAAMPMFQVGAAGPQPRWDADQNHFENRNIFSAVQPSQNTNRNQSRDRLAARNITDAAVPAPLMRNTTTAKLEAAKRIVHDAIAKSAKFNQARLEHPARNRYELKPGTIVGETPAQQRRRRARARTETSHPLLVITDEIADAAALVAEADAISTAGNPTRRAGAAAGGFWMQAIARKGTVPWGDDPAYKVYRSVHDYGAVGDGITVSTPSIPAIRAIPRLLRRR